MTVANRRRLHIVVKRIEELLQQQRRLREAQERGLVYARVRRKGYHVNAYDVDPTTVYCLVRPNPKRKTYRSRDRRAA